MSDELKPATDESPKTEAIKANAKTENPPSPPQIIPPIEKRPEDDRHSQEHWNDLTSWGKFKRVAKVVEFFGILAALIFICIQWHDIKSTGEDITTALDLVSNQVVTVQGQLDEMRHQTQELKANTIIDERAWVVISRIHSELNFFGTNAEPSSVYFNIPFRNSGRTPAIKVVPVIWHYTNINSIPPCDQFPNPVSNSSLLAPNSEGDDFTTTRIIPPIYPDLYKAIKNGKSYYFAGTIFYDDIFGRHHWTQFSYGVNPDLTFVPTTMHNSCDDANTNQAN